MNELITSPLKRLFLDELADRLDAEKRVIRALPRMKRTATCEQLQRLLQLQLRGAAGQVRKLEAIFKSFEVKPRVKKCAATVGLLEENDEILMDYKGSPALSAALISVARKIEHQAIASYGCLRDWAALLGNQPASVLLSGILAERLAANESLGELARTRSNNEALVERKDPQSGGRGMAGRFPNAGRGLRPMNLGRRDSVLT